MNQPLFTQSAAFKIRASCGFFYLKRLGNGVPLFSHTRTISYPFDGNHPAVYLGAVEMLDALGCVFARGHSHIAEASYSRGPCIRDYFSSNDLRDRTENELMRPNLRDKIFLIKNTLYFAIFGKMMLQIRCSSSCR